MGDTFREYVKLSAGGEVFRKILGPKLRNLGGWRRLKWSAQSFIKPNEVGGTKKIDQERLVRM